MDFKKFEIEGLMLITPQVFGDERGFFMETYNQKLFRENGIDVEFVQDNHSRSSKGVFRGMHFQLPPFSQGKLVRVIRGEVYDVAVDIRKNSSTFGKWQGVTLSEDNKNMFWMPPGFAHGFLVLSDTADFVYKVSHGLYSAEHAKGISFSDSQLNIDWPVSLDEIQANERDANWPLLQEIKKDLPDNWI